MVAKARPSKVKCPVEAYARDVSSGCVLAGRLVRLACERHLQDLKTGHERGLKFDKAAAQHALSFFGYLKLPEGDKDFVLQPWQKFIVGSLFGWKGEDGYRRFRTAYIESSKGTGKSPLLAGIGLYGLEADRELSAEVYSAATTREQANILFTDARNMANNSPLLSKRFDVGQHNIACPSTNSFFRPVSSEHRGLDGKRVHMGLLDEIHEHPTGLVVDKIRAGTKGRKQALICEITNSGHDRTTICWRHREYSDKILMGVLQDDSWFAYVCALDACEKCSAEGKTQPVSGCPDCDDWRDERVWLKACPNLGVSVTYKYMREQVREAQGMPAKENIVKRLNFCLWVEQADRIIPMDSWDNCGRAINPASLTGRSCFGGLDIGATSDFTAFELVFPHDDGAAVEIPIDPLKPDAGSRTIIRRSFSVLSWFWLPENPVKRDKQMQDVIDMWVRQGLIRQTPGNSVDYDVVLDDIVRILADYRIEGIGFDRGFQGGQMGTNLMKHFGDLVEQVPQGILAMNAPFRELLELLKNGRLLHDRNPVLRWMASNTAAEQRGGLVKPSKEHSAEKIDGITGLTMAVSLAIAGQQAVSSYETNELFVL